MVEHKQNHTWQGTPLQDQCSSKASRQEWAEVSIKHSALETPSDAMDLCWCKRSLHLRTMAIGLASWPFIPGEEMQKKFTSNSPGQGKEVVIPIFQAKYESTFWFCVSMMMIIFFDPTNHNQIALCSVFWLSNGHSWPLVYLYFKSSGLKGKHWSSQFWPKFRLSGSVYLSFRSNN